MLIFIETVDALKPNFLPEAPGAKASTANISIISLSIFLFLSSF